MIAAEEVLAYIHDNPGCLCVEIARALRTTAPHVNIELRALRERGEIVSDGNTRATRYRATE